MNLTMTTDEQREVIDSALDYNPSTSLPYGMHYEIVRFAADSAEQSAWCEAEIVAVVKAKGVFYALEGACDYTGWDCQSNLDVTEHDSLAAAISDGLTSDGRAMLRAAGATS